MGNALSDPVNMLEYGEFAYQTGLVDIHGKNAMKLFELLAKEYYPGVESKIVSSFTCCSMLNNLWGLFFSFSYHYHSFSQYWDTQLYAFIQSSNYSNLYNILQPEALDLESYRSFVEQSHVSIGFLKNNLLKILKFIQDLHELEIK